MDEWVLGRPVSLWRRIENAQGESCPILFRAFASSVRCVVLARSNNPQTEVHLDECEKEGIPVLRRRGGGGTVLLGPGCVILTVGFFARPLFDNELIFKAINQSWIDALEKTIPGVSALQIRQRGFSDLAVGDRKIAGTSLFRRKHLAVFQGSLLVCPQTEWIERCLRHPTREPDYRKGRSHGDFMTTLCRLGLKADAGVVASQLQSGLSKAFENHLGNLAIPQPEDVFHL